MIRDDISKLNIQICLSMVAPIYTSYDLIRLYQVLCEGKALSFDFYN